MHVRPFCAIVAALVLAAPAAAATRVTVITDSAGSALLAPEIARELGRDLDLRFEVIVCRKLATPGCGLAAPESALATILRLGPALGPIVVLDVGYNDTNGEVAAAIDPIMQALVANGVQHVIWTTLAEREGVWVVSNELVRAAAGRWPQLAFADWATTSAPHDEWFVDDAHLNLDGARALATLLRAQVLSECGNACRPRPVFCGLVRTANGFDYVDATATSCAEARRAVAGVERGDPGDWICARSTGRPVELDCRRGGEEARVLERSPVPARRQGAVVTLANWSFRLRGALLQGREHARGWISLGRAPWCVPDVPREALTALRLHRLTPSGGCFARR